MLWADIHCTHIIMRFLNNVYWTFLFFHRCKSCLPLTWTIIEHLAENPNNSLVQNSLGLFSLLLLLFLIILGTQKLLLDRRLRNKKKPGACFIHLMSVFLLLKKPELKALFYWTKILSDLNEKIASSIKYMITSCCKQFFQVLYC